MCTEQRLRQGVNIVRGKVSDQDTEGTRVSVQRLLAHSERMIQVATRVVDHSQDALYRNGIMVFVQRLQAGMSNLFFFLFNCIAVFSLSMSQSPADN